jgi:hypothetical protein
MHINENLESLPIRNMLLVATLLTKEREREAVKIIQILIIMKLACSCIK